MALACSMNAGMLTEFDVHLRQMVDNAEFCDVTFLCEDGIQVHGCRMLLAARCPFFQGMLFGEMTESRNSKVDLPTISSSVLILVMKFLYTGKLVLEDLKPATSTLSPLEKGDGPFKLDWSSLLRAAVTAQYFLLDDLQKVITDLLWEDLPQGDSMGSEDSVRQLAKAFSLIHQYPTLLIVGTIGALCTSMAASLRSSDLSPATLSVLSEPAFTTYLEKTQRSWDQEPWAEIIDEYLRIRDIVTWSAVLVSGTENLDRTCLPGPEAAMNFIYSSEDDRSNAASDFSRGRTSFINRIAKESLRPLLKESRTGYMPTPESNIWDLGAESGKTRRIASKDDETLILTVRWETSSFKVAAFAGLQMRSCDTLEWEIGITPQGSLEKLSMANFEFGLVTVKHGKPFCHESISRLSAHSRCFAIRVGSDLRSARLYMNRRRTFS
ncbi:hypothetical protein R1sor_015746 [Riccia sorocarpa]|uniref:BTB domain-containing protein n=1 Tax=Riccia sorocarpa TaxID=122646 RepID=A0ABD3HFT4_9MARC